MRTILNLFFLIMLTACSSSTEELEVSGCTDITAINYNPNATLDDGSCQYDTNTDILGCTDPEAINYNPDATLDDESCIYGGCTNPNAANFDVNIVIDDGSCTNKENLGGLLFTGIPKYIFGGDNGVIMSPSINSTQSVSYDFINKESKIIDGTKFIEFENLKNENYNLTYELPPSASELRKTELYKINSETGIVKVYYNTFDGEVLQSLSTLPNELSANNGEVILNLSLIQNAFKVNNYLYFYLRYRDPNNPNVPWYRLFRSNDYGYGEWEELFSNINFFQSSLPIKTDKLVIANDKRILLGTSTLEEINSETLEATGTSFVAPSDLGAGQDGFITVKKYFEQEESFRYIHYKFRIYEGQGVDNTDRYRFWYFDDFFNSWKEANTPVDVTTLARFGIFDDSTLLMNKIFSIDINENIWMISPI